MNRSNGPPISRSYDVRYTDSLAFDSRLNKYIHVHVVERVDSTPPIEVRIDVRVVFDGLGETENDERGKRELFPRLLFYGLDVSSRLGYVDLDEAMDVASLARHPHVIDRSPATGRERFDSITSSVHRSHKISEKHTY